MLLRGPGAATVLTTEHSLGRPGQSPRGSRALSSGARRDLGSRPPHLAPGSWFGNCSPPAQRLGRRRGWAGAGVGGGSAQGGDDVTAQPLKDELFLPALELPCSSSAKRGHRAALPDAGPGSDRPRGTAAPSGQGGCPLAPVRRRAFAGRTGSPSQREGAGGRRRG